DTTKTYKLELYTSDDATRLLFLDDFVPSEDSVLVSLAAHDGAMTVVSLTSTGDVVIGGTLDVTGLLTAAGVLYNTSGGAVGQVLGWKNSTDTLEPMTPATGAGDLLANANETITGNWTFSGDIAFSGTVAHPEGEWVPTLTAASPGTLNVTY